MLPYFDVIVVVALAKVYTESAPIEPRHQMNMRWITEVEEMVIGLAALLYAWRKWRDAGPRPAVPG